MRPLEGHAAMGAQQNGRGENNIQVSHFNCTGTNACRYLRCLALIINIITTVTSISHFLLLTQALQASISGQNPIVTSRLRHRITKDQIIVPNHDIVALRHIRKALSTACIRSASHTLSEEATPTDKIITRPHRLHEHLKLLRTPRMELSTPIIRHHLYRSTTGLN